MYPLHSDDFLTGFPLRFLCSSLLCPQTYTEFFDDSVFCQTFQIGFFEQGRLALSREFLIEILSNCFFRASSASEIFEAGLRSLKLFLSG
jgi:hypothetical protein